MMTAQVKPLSKQGYSNLKKYIEDPLCNIWCIKINPNNTMILKSLKASEKHPAFVFKIHNTDELTIDISHANKSKTTYAITENQLSLIIKKIHSLNHRIVFENVDYFIQFSKLEVVSFDSFLAEIKSRAKYIKWNTLTLTDIVITWNNTPFCDKGCNNYIFYYCTIKDKNYYVLSGHNKIICSLTTLPFDTPRKQTELRNRINLNIDDLPVPFKRHALNSLDQTTTFFKEISDEQFNRIIRYTHSHKANWNCEIQTNSTLWSAELGQGYQLKLLSYERHTIINIYNFRENLNDICTLKAGDFEILLDEIKKSCIVKHYTSLYYSDYFHERISDAYLYNYIFEQLYKDCYRLRFHVSINADAIHYVCIDKNYRYHNLEIHYVFGSYKLMIKYVSNYRIHFIGFSDFRFIKNFSHILSINTATKQLNLNKGSPDSYNINVIRTKFDYSPKRLYRMINRYIINHNNTSDTRTIAYSDLVVRCNMFRCRYNSHTLISVTALIDIKTSDGIIRTENITAGFCNTCKVYFIHEDTYKHLKSLGRIMCRIIKIQQYDTWNENNSLDSMNTYSILKEYGYTVSKQADLSTLQRQEILSEILDNNILTPTEVLSYLNLFISLRENDYSMSDAINKWTEDIHYVVEYKKQHTHSNVKVHNIITR